MYYAVLYLPKIIMHDSMCFAAGLPSITSLFSSTSNPVVGEPFSIRCSVTGTPPLIISWKKDGRVLEPSADEVLRIVASNIGRTSSVEVSKARSEFSGVYECIATNVAGSVNKSSPVQLLQLC